MDIYAEGGDIYIGSNTEITGDNDLSGSQMADIWAGDTVGAIDDEDASTRGTISFEGTLKQNADGDYVLASGEYTEGTYGGNVVHWRQRYADQTTVAAGKHHHTRGQRDLSGNGRSVRLPHERLQRCG